MNCLSEYGELPRYLRSVRSVLHDYRMLTATSAGKRRSRDRLKMSMRRLCTTTFEIEIDVMRTRVRLLIVSSCLVGFYDVFGFISWLMQRFV